MCSVGIDALEADLDVRIVGWIGNANSGQSVEEIGDNVSGYMFIILTIMAAGARVTGFIFIPIRNRRSAG